MNQYTYLEHHGIKGQKWGVRRYQNEDGTLTPAGKMHEYSETASTYLNSAGNRIKKAGSTAGNGIKKAGSTVVEKHKIRKDARKQLRRDVINNTKNAKGLANKYSQFTGSGYRATLYKNNAEKERKLSNASMTKFGKHKHDVWSKNSENISKYYDAYSKKSFGEKFVESYTHSDLFKVPITRMSGRTTTLGHEYISQLFGDVPGTIGDIKYKMNGGR